MTCRHVEPLLSSYHEGLLSEREASAIAAHLEKCSACRRLQGVFTAMAAALRDLEEPLPPAGLRRRAIRRWQAEHQATRAPWRLWFFAGRNPLAPARAAGGPSFGWIAVALLTLLGFALSHRELRELLLLSAKPPLSDRVTRSLTAAPPPIANHSRITLPQRAGARQGRPHGHVGPSLPSVGVPGESGASPTFGSGSPLQRRDRDDLRYVNWDPTAAIRQWAALSRNEETRIEARLRREVRAKDDFVQIPFPRLAAVSDRQVAAAAEGYKREAVIVDDRLSRDVTLALKATALTEVCARLKADSGIDLRAGPSVADEKVTLFCTKMPLREVMRQLSHPFGYAWLRSRKEGGEYRYELVQDLRSQLLEEELRNRDRNAALLALDAEMQRYRQYLGLSPDEALARARTASPEEKKLLERYAGVGWGPAQLYFRLSPNDLNQMRAGKEVTYSAERSRFWKPDHQPLPPELARGILESERKLRIVERDGRLDWGQPNGQEGLPPSQVPAARAITELRIEQSELGRFTFGGAHGCFISESAQPSGSFYVCTNDEVLAVGMSPSVLNPKNGESHARLAHDPLLRKRVMVKPQPSCTAEGKPRVTTADVLEALHRATGRPIVADFYTRLYPLAEGTVRNESLFDALNRLADRMRLRWQQEAPGPGPALRAPAREAGGWLQFRSTSYFHDRLKEVPNRLLTRWAASRQQHGALTLDDLIEIAQLSDAQLDAASMAEGARDLWGLAEWNLAPNAFLRPHLRFLAEFTPAQRQEAQRPGGLAFTKMTLRQQQEYLAYLHGDGSPPLGLEELARWTMRVEYTLPGEYQWLWPGWRTYLGSRVRERTRIAALQAARRIDPEVTEEQIVPTRLDLLFCYTAAGENPPWARVVRVDIRGAIP